MSEDILVMFLGLGWRPKFKTSRCINTIILHPLVSKMGEHKMRRVRKVEKIGKIREIERIERVKEVKKAIAKMKKTQ